MLESRSHITQSPEDDDELLRRARGGDTQARGELVSRYQETILRFCQTYLGGLHDAEDAAQDVMACVATGDQLPDQRFRPWLYRVARNRCLAVLRTRRNGRVAAGSVLELSEPVVKSRLFEARQKLREQLQESRGGP